jgi:glycosyltransferase involved in cell wall biosynthesis
MNILMLNYEYPPLGGGAGQVTVNICKQLARHNKVFVVTTWFEGLPEVEENDNLIVYRLKCRRKNKFGSNIWEMLSWIKFSLKFCDEFLERHDVDIIFSHFSIPGGEVAYRLNKRFNIPYVVMSHGHDIPWFYPQQMFLYHVLLYSRIRKICRVSKANFMLSPDMKSNADRFTGREYSNKNVIIPNACDTSFFPHIKNREFDKLRLVFVGRFVHQKQPLAVLQALALLHNKNIDFQANFAGNGPLLNKIQLLIAKYGLKDKVTVKGWLSLDEIKEEYAKAHLFVMPSKAEGMSVAIIEALVSGLFVITSKAGNQYDLIKEDINGYVLENNTPEEIASKIEKFYAIFFMKNKAVPNKAVQEIIGIYNWENVGERYMEMLRRV